MNLQVAHMKNQVVNMNLCGLYEPPMVPYKRLSDPYEPSNGCCEPSSGYLRYKYDKYGQDDTFSLFVQLKMSP